jgi:NTP pyrophosphatase (non-canonical NTP hydrolase)
MKLNELSKKCHEIAKSKGFYDDIEFCIECGNEGRNISELLMLIVSELGEACEALRKNKHADLENFKRFEKDNYIENGFISSIKDTFEDEIADTFIRLFDLCGYLNIDIEKYIELKMQYNKSREHKHGKEF